MCYQGKKQSPWNKSIFLYIHAVVSWDKGGKWVNSLHKRASSGVLPAPASSCSNTNMSANHLLNPYKASCISNRQISALVWCFCSLTGCGHFKAAKSLHCHPPPCSCSACTVEQRQGKSSALFFTPKPGLLLYLSTMITHRWRVQLFLDICLAPASWRKLSTHSQHIPQQCLFTTAEHGCRTELIPEDTFLISVSNSTRYLACLWSLPVAYPLTAAYEHLAAHSSPLQISGSQIRVMYKHHSECLLWGKQAQTYRAVWIGNGRADWPQQETGKQNKQNTRDSN